MLMLLLLKKHRLLLLGGEWVLWHAVAEAADGEGGLGGDGRRGVDGRKEGLCG